MGKAIAMFCVLLVVGVVLAGMIGRATAPQPTPIPDAAQVVVAAEQIVSTAAAGGSVEISDQTVEVIGVADQVADLGAHALDVQAGVASDGLDTARDIAVAGYGANVAISMNGTFGMVAIVFIIFGGAALILYFFAQVGKKTEKSGD